MSDYTDLLAQAATGSIAAQSSFAHASMTAAATGAVRQVDALMAAEAWARLAAASGDRAGTWSLVEVLLARVEFELERCAVRDARWYEDEARCVLKWLADAGDGKALEALAEIGETINEAHQGPTTVTLANLAAAANGNLVALGALYDEAIGFLNAGADPGEALAIAEVYARLGAHSGNSDHIQRLAGVLLKRAELEYQAGDKAAAEAAHAEATFLVAVLVDTECHHLRPWLAELVSDPTLPAIVHAVQHRPTILLHIEPRGAC